jgi:hypothetical protein
MNDLDLSSLATTPVAPLAEASAVRARGEQRRQRARAAVAGAAALVVLAGAGTALALSSGARPDALVPAGPTPSETSSLENPPIGLAGALLQPSDISAVLGGRWFSREALVEGGQPVLDVCGEPLLPVLGGLQHLLYDGRGGTVLTQVSQLREGGGADYLGSLSTLASRCPAGPPQTPRTGESAPPRDTLLPLGEGQVGLRQQRVVCADACEEQTAYWVIVVVGDLVGWVSVDDGTRLAAWAQRAQARLAACHGTCPAPERRHPEGFPEDVELRVGDVAWVVTIGGTLPDGTTADPDEARGRALLLGYTAVRTRAGCLDGLAGPGVTIEPGTQEVVVPFFTQEKATAFHEGYLRTSGGTSLPPTMVTVRCLS